MLVAQGSLGGCDGTLSVAAAGKIGPHVVWCVTQRNTMLTAGRVATERSSMG